MITYKESIALFQTSSRSKIVGRLLSVLWSMYQTLMEIEIFYYICYIIFSLFGALIHPFFFCFHLTEILFRFSTLSNILQSVYQPRLQLALTFILYLILNYMFTLIAFLEFETDYQGNCDNLFLCFIITFDWSFKANGGIGGYLYTMSHQDNLNQDKFPFSSKRLAFDNIYYILLQIIMINIVSGIIIDKFGELRSQE